MESLERVHVIACGVLAIDMALAAERSGAELTTAFLPGGLHARPQELRKRLQEAIDEASTREGLDKIAIGYGVCGRGAAGIHARHVPLAIPRVHDCIALFLGSDAAYREQFAKYPGTYYISAGFVEAKAQPQSTRKKKAVPVGQTNLTFEQLVEKYGAENADFIRSFFNSWHGNYRRAAFIDTGAGERKQRYARIARAMAEEFGWRYEELSGSHDLLQRLISARKTSREILIVPPHHVTAYDAIEGGLKAVPVWQSDEEPENRSHTLIFDSADGAPAEEGRKVRLGLGIDAGGTYTDAVIYDFRGGKVLSKAKALTTKWDFTIGIGQALDGLSDGHLARVDLVSLSTTLATNAIVEGQGQKVGLLVLPAYGLYKAGDIDYSPLAVLDGQMEIDGSEIAPIDPDQVRRAARAMVEKDKVKAFAVAGYASHNNPAHEIQVRDIVRQETGMTVVCGHDVSEGLNYRLRAVTAALNARIIPCLRALLEQVRDSLRRRGVAAPVMVVRSDGSLMSVEAAVERPIETILSGPAASVAGARYLARRQNAIVVDVGGTTTDTACIQDGEVRVCPEGAVVGGWKTHVRALDMRTMGLGGDSLIAFERRQIAIGPRRVAPVAWMARRNGGCAGALDWLERHADDFASSTKGMEIVSLGDGGRDLDLGDDERLALRLLEERPHSLAELTQRILGSRFRKLSLERLEAGHAIQRAALTPTDMLHAAGRLSLWNDEAAKRIAGLTAGLLGIGVEELFEWVFRQAVDTLAVELLKKQLDEEADGDTLGASRASRALIENMLRGGSRGYRVSVELRRPVIGIGAPVSFFLPEAAKKLGTEAIIPPDADVANAIGAITSLVFIHKTARVAPNEFGRYAVQGLSEAPTFLDFQDAHKFAVEALREETLRLARQAGSSQTRIEIAIDDHVAPVADGGRIFLGRRLEARLSGAPDLARLAQ